jgi:DNA mismatch repair protein MutS2
MRLKEAIQHTSGLRCVVEGMEICSSVGRRMLHEMTWLGEESAITAEHDRIASVLRLLETEAGRDRTETIRRKLALLRDIRSTIERTGGNCVFDDIELFELKFFALLAEELRPLASQGHLAELPELNGVVDLLDPEGNRLPHFFVYDAYSEELATLRKQIKARKQAGADESQVQELYFRSVEIEDRIRERLSVELRKYHEALQQALDRMGWLDVVIAKAMQARDWGLTRPAITQDTTSFRGLFNPELRISLEAAGKRFQPVNIRLTTGPTVITGANMSGKTVLLHSVELAQYMLQFGFYIAAERAEIALVDEVHCSIGDGQDQLSGLSSFAAEFGRQDELRGRRFDLVRDHQEVEETLDAAQRPGLRGLLASPLVEPRHVAFDHLRFDLVGRDVPLAQDEVRELHVVAHVRFDGVFREPLLQFYIATVTAAGFVPLFCIFCHLLVR